MQANISQFNKLGLKNLNRDQQLVASAMDLLQSREKAYVLNDAEGGGTLTRSRSQANKLAEKSVPINTDAISHASSLRNFGKKSASRAMVSNSYRILDKNRVSHEQLASASPASLKAPPEGPTINLNQLKRSQWGKSPVSVSAALKLGNPANKFVTMDHKNRDRNKPGGEEPQPGQTLQSIGLSVSQFNMANDLSKTGRARLQQAARRTVNE